MREMLKVRGLQAGLVLLLLGIWWYATGPGGTSPLLIPSIGSTLEELVALVGQGATWANAAVTGFEVLAAVVLAVGVGFAIGFWLSRSNLRVLVAEPMVAWAYMVPFVLFYPLLLLWLGVDMESKIAFGFLNGVFAMALNTLKGFKSVDRNLIRAARAYGATPRQIEWTVKLPSALPVVLAGARVAIALALITVILAEMIGSRRGLGHELLTSSVTLATAQSYAYVILILGMVTVLHFMVERLAVKR